MYKILGKRELAPNIFLMDIEAKRVAKSCLPGQFVIVKADDKAERVPLAICDYDAERGSVSIVYQTLGDSTRKMAKYEVGKTFSDFAGPLGQPSEFVYGDLEELKNKKMIFIADGASAGPIYSQVKWLHEHGIDVDVMLGCKSKEYLMFQEEIKGISANLYIATDDGSYGYKGYTKDLLIELIKKERKKYDRVVAIGPIAMMQSVSEVTRNLGIKTIVSLKAIMVDGMGMCGGCRVTVGGETKFACLDGPEFDGHLVNFEEVIKRQAMYNTEEGKSLLDQQEKEEGHVCHVALEDH